MPLEGSTIDNDGLEMNIDYIGTEPIPVAIPKNIGALKKEPQRERMHALFHPRDTLRKFAYDFEMRIIQALEARRVIDPVSDKEFEKDPTAVAPELVEIVNTCTLQEIDYALESVDYAIWDGFEKEYNTQMRQMTKLNVIWYFAKYADHRNRELFRALKEKIEWVRKEDQDEEEPSGDKQLQFGYYKPYATISTLL